MNYQILFSGKIKKNPINLLSAESAHSMVSGNKYAVNSKFLLILKIVTVNKMIRIYWIFLFICQAVC